MTYQDILERRDWQLLHVISGSQAYGTALPTSDTDTKGVFVLPRALYFGMDTLPQVADERNDHVFYELGRFVELLAKNNPNMLELLAPPEGTMLYRHPLMDELPADLFLSKRCFPSFAGYAQTQIQKARGLHKKIVNPVEKERKTILHFCYVTQDGGSEPFLTWLQKHGYRQEHCGLSKLPHFRDGYALYYDTGGRLGYQGVMRKSRANEVSLSAIPKGELPVAYLSFNKDGYQTYCKDYRQYWAWVDHRNEERYQNTQAHGKRYDAKNMLHVFRLLGMAEDIAREGALVVRRPEAPFLLAIRHGEFEYDELVRQAHERVENLRALFAKSKLPEQPDRNRINQRLAAIREEWYEL